MSWKSNPSWRIVADTNGTVQAELQRFVAKRMSATVFETDGSRAPKLAQADLVLEIVRKAGNAVQRLMRRKVHRPCLSEPKANPGDAKDEAPLQASVDFLRTYSAVVDVLTATVLNAEAGLNWMSAQPPDLEKLRRTLNTIADDGKRVGEIVVALRAAMNRSPLREDAVDF